MNAAYERAKHVMQEIIDAQPTTLHDPVERLNALQIKLERMEVVAYRLEQLLLEGGDKIDIQSAGLFLAHMLHEAVKDEMWCR